jgi:hypothetical protein
LERYSPSDWDAFYSGGATVGTKAFYPIGHLLFWERAHGLLLEPFLYLPGFAWFLKPFTLLGASWSYALAVAVLAGCALWTGAILARLYDLPRWLAVGLSFAWPPMVYALEGGQTAPFGMLLMSAAGLLLTRARTFSAGVLIGALAYKPSFAVPFFVLLIVRREWRALIGASLWLPIWYLLSVLATHNWLWPVEYVHVLRLDIPLDFAANATQAFAIPALLVRLGLSGTTATAIGCAIFISFVPLLKRGSIEESMAVAALLAVVCSPHAWIYDAVLALPMLLVLVRSAAGPMRTRILIASCAFAYIGFASYGTGPGKAPILGFNPLALVTLGLLAFAGITGFRSLRTTVISRCNITSA